MLSDEQPHDPPNYPRLRGIGHVLGLLYVLVTLLFGPIRSLARWLGQQQWIQRYQQWVATLPPAMALILSLSSLVLLELTKIIVLLAFRAFGVLAAVGVTLCAKASIGYFAHLTWQAARPQVITAYPWAAKVDAWIGAQLAQLRRFRDRWLAYLRSRAWYTGIAGPIWVLRKRAAHMMSWIKAKLAATVS